MAKKLHLLKKKTTAPARGKQSKDSVSKTVTSTARPTMPKFIGFTKEVLRTLWTEKRLFLRLFLATSLVALLLFGATQQDQYVETTNALDAYAAQLADDGFDTTLHFSVLLATAATGGLNTTLSETQKAYFFALYFIVWLTTIWLLRHRLAGATVMVRDGLYNAGAPIVAMVALFFVATLQLLPMALGVIVYSAAVASGILNGVLETVLFGSLVVILSVVSLYLLTSTVIATLIATNPGTYPLAALKAAKRVVAGRRTRFMFHLLWLAFLIVLLWVVVLVPAVMIDSWLHQAWIPLVVLCIQVVTSFSVIFASAYIYLLYRKMIDEPAK